MFHNTVPVYIIDPISYLVPYWFNWWSYLLSSYIAHATMFSDIIIFWYVWPLLSLSAVQNGCWVWVFIVSIIKCWHKTDKLSTGVSRKTGDDAHTNRTSGSRPMSKKVQSKLFTFCLHKCLHWWLGIKSVHSLSQILLLGVSHQANENIILK